MDIIQEIEDDEPQIKPAKPTMECEKMLDEALTYIAENSQTQAEIMRKKFFKILRILEYMPGIGTIYKNGMRKFKLGKFRYNIYYREKENEIEIVGIWHTSRGTDFVEPAEI